MNVNGSQRFKSSCDFETIINQDKNYQFICGILSMLLFALT